MPFSPACKASSWRVRTLEGGRVSFRGEGQCRIHGGTGQDCSGFRRGDAGNTTGMVTTHAMHRHHGTSLSDLCLAFMLGQMMAPIQMAPSDLEYFLAVHCIEALYGFRGVQIVLGGQHYVPQARGHHAQWGATLTPIVGVHSHWYSTGVVRCNRGWADVRSRHLTQRYRGSR